MDLHALQEKYKSVPSELKALKRWVCFNVEGTEDGKTTKRPYNALTGKKAKVNDEITWTTFNNALNGCVKYHHDGIGFVLGFGIFGIDLDNHADKDGNVPMSDEEFKTFSTQFIDALDSYTEYSQSGKGIHIICSGQLPEGSRRKGCVEMYDSGRFFAFTGNTIRNTTINERSEEVKPLWEKYVKSEYAQNVVKREPNRSALVLSDDEILNTALASKQGAKFYAYYHDGDISMDGGDASSADMSFCNMLAWWCNGDKAQMDRIFRSSALMRDKWDEYRGEYTYGEKTLLKAIQTCDGGYSGERLFTNGDTRGMTVADKKFTIRSESGNTELSSTELNPDGLTMNIDDEGEPIFRIKKIFKRYPLTDTGNAERFYDYFGEIFRYNTTDECFMFWTGKTWVKDTKDIIRKYADKFIAILKAEEDEIHAQALEAQKEGNDAKSQELVAFLAELIKNTKKVSNKAGKDAMLAELKHTGKMAVENTLFDQDPYLLNTESGVVDLRTGEILPQETAKDYYMSKNTNIKVSFEEPTEWLKFLRSVFMPSDNNMYDAEECVNAVQTYLGYSLSGSTKEQVMFLLYGIGSNGKSTLTETVAKIMGDYSSAIPSAILMAQKNNTSSAVEFALARLRGVRFVETGETDNGGKLAESQIKLLTGGDKIQAQFKFGQPFEFYPQFKIWMSTNNRPIITGTDEGIWRRPKTLPFINSFTGDKKDKFLPEKLQREYPQILGWCIQGFVKYWNTRNAKGENCNFAESKIFTEDKAKYRQKMDVVAQFVKDECKLTQHSKTEAKEMFAAFKTWAKDNNELQLKETVFRERLQRLANIKTEMASTGARMYCGIRLNGVYIGGDKI